jgi:hypothetical protein
LDVGLEEPSPFHGAGFCFEEEGVFDVFEGGDEELVFYFWWKASTAVFALVGVVDYEPHLRRLGLEYVRRIMKTYL